MGILPTKLGLGKILDLPSGGNFSQIAFLAVRCRALHVALQGSRDSH